MIGPLSKTEDNRKYVVWKTDTEADYINAHWSMEQDGKLFFIVETLTESVVVKRYDVGEWKGYNKVE